MTTYWLLGEKEQIAPPSVTVGVQDEQNVATRELEVALSTPNRNPEDQKAHLNLETGSVPADTSKKARFIDDLSEDESENRDSNNRSSIANNPSNSRMLGTSSSQASQHSAHIISNPMTSIVIIDNEDTEERQTEHIISKTSFHQQKLSAGYVNKR